MKTLLAMLLALASAASSFSADALFYIGTYTKSGKSQGIYSARLDTETGRLGAVELAGEVPSPSFVAQSPDGKFLYAAIEAEGGAVAAFAVGAGGGLTKLNQLATGGSGTCHVWVDATGRNVLAANYGGGSIACLRANPDGSLGERSAFVQFEGSGPNLQRQQKPHGHAIYTDATNRFVYACDLGTDNVWTFRFDAAKGTLTPADPPSGKVPPGGGPRHLAIHPGGKFAYANNELSLSVTAFSRDAETGALTPLQTLPTVPEGTPTEGVSTAEIFCHPTGRWLYVSNRGHDTLAVYGIAADGKLTWIENAPAQVKVPRGFGIDPSGRWLVTAGQNDDRIAVLKIDPATGRLTDTGQRAEVGSPVCILFAPVAARTFPDPVKLPSRAALPDVLTMFAGQPVQTHAAWVEKRAPELRALVQAYEYGFLPPSAKVTAKLEREERAALGGAATLREITLSLAQPEGAKIRLLLVVPNGRTRPAPVFLGLNFQGNHALLADPLLRPPDAWKPKKNETLEQSRGAEIEAWALDQAVARGYAVASFFNGDVVPDDQAAAETVLRKLRPLGRELRGPDDCATIAAWAWCLHRAVDYLVTDADLDTRRIALVGHSRNGKTALLAAALDERVALVVPSQAGCGGTAPCRLPPELAAPPDGKLIVETVKRINTAFPHWFCENFKAFNDATDRLPFDQHALIALCAPRPVLLSCAVNDRWANPAGQFEILRAADPVYRLVAGDGLGAATMPEPGQLLASRLGYFIRPGNHSMTRADWKVWLDFADRWLPPPR